MICPICGSTCRRVRKKQLTDKDLKKAYFFTEFDKCGRCSFIKLDSEYIIQNKTSNRLQSMINKGGLNI